MQHDLDEDPLKNIWWDARGIVVSSDAKLDQYHYSKYGRSALQAASRGGHIEVIEELLAAGAKVNTDLAID